MKSVRHRTAIICRGGGMRSAHGAGFIYALENILKIETADMVIGSSGNAASAISYSAQGKDECLKTVWTECLSTSKFISYLRPTRLMDVDYLIDEVFKKKIPQLRQMLEVSPVEYYISIVDAETGIARFITKQDDIDPFELLRASKAMPLVYRKKVRIQGRDYIDGSIGQTPQSQIDLVLSLGATRIVFIDDSPPRTILLKGITFLYALCAPQGLRQKILQDILTKRTHSVPDEVRLLYVYRARMPVSVMTRNRRKLADTFELGIQDALSQREKLEELLQ